jgi:hypothetical protein
VFYATLCFLFLTFFQDNYPESNVNGNMKSILTYLANVLQTGRREKWKTPNTCRYFLLNVLTLWSWFRGDINSHTSELKRKDTPGVCSIAVIFFYGTISS